MTICILKFEDNELVGWIIAESTHVAKKKAERSGHFELARELDEIKFDPSPGKHPLKTLGCVMLVDYAYIGEKPCEDTRITD